MNTKVTHHIPARQVTSKWLVLWTIIADKLVYVGPEAEYVDGKLIRTKG